MNNTNQKLVLLAILAGAFLVPVNSTMIAVGLPSIASSLNVSVSSVTWVVTIYLIVMAVSQPIAGKLGDIYGNKKIMIFGFGLFFLSSIACTFSFNLISLIVFRSLQALGGALVTPNTTAIIRYVIPKDKLSNVLGVFGLSMGLGAAIGPLLGSGLITWFSWEAIFWVNVPFLIFSILMSWRSIPNVDLSKNHSIDLLGSLYLGVILTVVTLLVTHAEYFNIWTVLILTIALVLFIYQERTVNAPLIEFKMFKSLTFSSSNTSIFINNFVMYSTILFIPILLESYEFSVGTIGLLLFAFSIAMSLSSWMGGRLATRFGRQSVIALSFILLGGTVLFYFGFTAGVSFLYVLSALLLGGFAAGVGLASMQASNLESVPKEKSGVASGIYSTFRYMGGMMASVVVSLFVGNIALYVILLTFSIIGVFLSIAVIMKTVKSNRERKVLEA